MLKFRTICAEIIASTDKSQNLKKLARNKMDWFDKWLELKTPIKEYQWDLINSSLPAKHINDKLYTFNELIKLDKDQATNIFSLVAQKAMKEFELDFKTAINLTYLQELILQSENVLEKVNNGELTFHDALKLTREDFRNIKN